MVLSNHSVVCVQGLKWQVDTPSPIRNSDGGAKYFLTFPWFICHIKSALEGCPGDTFLPLFSTHPALRSFLSLYPGEPNLCPQLGNPLSIQELCLSALQSRRASYWLSTVCVWILQCGYLSEPGGTFRKASFSYTVLSQTLSFPGGGVEGKKTWKWKETLSWHTSYCSFYHYCCCCYLELHVSWPLVCRCSRPWASQQ